MTARFLSNFGIVRLQPLRWKVTKRVTGRLWWKRELYDAEGDFVSIRNMTLEQVAMLPGRFELTGNVTRPGVGLV